MHASLVLYRDYNLAWDTTKDPPSMGTTVLSYQLYIPEEQREITQ